MRVGGKEKAREADWLSRTAWGGLHGRAGKGQNKSVLCEQQSAHSGAAACAKISTSWVRINVPAETGTHSEGAACPSSVSQLSPGASAPPCEASISTSCDVTTLIMATDKLMRSGRSVTAASVCIASLCRHRGSVRQFAQESMHPHITLRQRHKLGPQTYIVCRR